MWCSFAFVIFILMGTVRTEDGDPMVQTEFGVHKGVWSKTSRDQTIASFLGIPYAEPPVRFQKPSPWTRHFRAVWDSTKYRPPCLPYGGYVGGSENCLYLNIHTPQMKQNPVDAKNVTNRAVLVFLIGNLLGNNSNALYDPFYLLDQDIVLVTVNYRYGYFGFFTTGDKFAPGNYGLKDVLQALEWLQNNVARFGGDPDSVTLMGQGAEAGIVHLLALSEKSEGLFHRYVTQSGAAQSARSYRSPEIAKAKSLQSAAWVYCNQSTSEETVECMRSIPASVRTDEETFLIVSPWESYGPTAEPESEDAVITEHPVALMQNGKMRDIPWMTGVVADEGLPLRLDLGGNTTVCSKLGETFEDIVLGLANSKAIVDTPAYIEMLALFYFNGNLTVDCEETLSEMIGDILVNWPVYETLIDQSSQMESNVYFYKFAYIGTFSTSFRDGSTDRFGVCHGDEVNYLFPALNHLFADLQQRNTERDITMINILTEMWANFAKTGVPNARFSPEWEAYQEDQGYMEFGPGAEISMQNDFLQDRMIFWYNLTEQFAQDITIPEDEPSRGTAAFGGMKNGYIPKYSFNLLAQILVSVIFAR